MSRQQARLIILAKRPLISSIALCDYLESREEYPPTEFELLEDFDIFLEEYYGVLA